MIKSIYIREIVKSVYEAVGDIHQEGGILKGNVDYLRQILAEDIE